MLLNLKGVMFRMNFLSKGGHNAYDWVVAIYSIVCKKCHFIAMNIWTIEKNCHFSESLLFKLFFHGNNHIISNGNNHIISNGF